MTKTLLLWDIDGTLISSGGAGERALVDALHEEFGIRGTLEDIELGGRTDRWIARRVLAKFAVPDTSENIGRYLDRYVKLLAGHVNNPAARTLPGVPELLAEIARDPAFTQGLLTGNLRRGAEIKLGRHQLWAHFAFGAFGDDGEQRNDLGAHALRRAAKHHDIEFAIDRVFVIGDTPHDIACGKAIGARTIAVATGTYRVEQLRAHQPTAVFADLSDTHALLAVLAPPEHRGPGTPAGTS